MTIARQKLAPDHYTVEDYYGLTEDVHVELIDGVFYDMAQPSRIHQGLVMLIASNIQRHIDNNKGLCKVYPAPFGVQPREDDDKTIVEPDISVICDRDKFTDRGCFGAPDWIVEIVSPSNPVNDYVRKLCLYLDSGVREYWIVDPMTEKVFVYIMEEGNLGVSAYSLNDQVPSHVLEELVIDFGEMDLS